jgi:glycosyltransferase involved in cell wall biosynthesis
MEKSKLFLMVSYDFPPIGGGGVQRNVKFLKYLSRLGWKTAVLTVKERDFYVYDYTLLNEIKDSTVIHKSNSLDPVSISYKIKTFIRRFKSSDKNNVQEESVVNESAWYVGLYRVIRNWVLLPDGYGGWIPLAYRKGIKVIQETRPDVLYATFPGPSNAFVTYKLAKKFNIPYVIDFRDGWIDDPYNVFPSTFHKKYHSYYERKIVLGASKVIVYANSLRDILENKYPVLKGKINVITNGFDPEDFEGLVPIAKTEGKIRLVYSGAVYIDRRETYTNFIKAVCKLDHQIKDKLEIIFVGDKLKWASDLVSANSLEKVISFTGYLTHKEALNYLASADGCLMFLRVGDMVALTGKIFEYLAMELPIIACVEPNGACAQLLKSINHDAGVCSPTNPTEIADRINKLVLGQMNRLSADDKKVYSRAHHTERLNDILNEIIN